MTFWKWFVSGSGGHPGYRRIVNRWLLFHVAVGVAVAFAVPASIAQTANAVLVPLIGVFVGLSFAWGANAQSMLQTDQIRRMTAERAGGFAEYVFTFQIAMFVILATLAVWGLGGLSVFDQSWPTTVHPFAYGAVEITLYGLASLAVRECWHVIVGTQLMLLQWSEIKREEEKSKRECDSQDHVPD